jgi:hypothetical protein
MMLSNDYCPVAASIAEYCDEPEQEEETESDDE